MHRPRNRAGMRAGTGAAAAAVLLGATSAAYACSTPLPVLTTTLGGMGGCGDQCAPTPGCPPTGGSGTISLHGGGGETSSGRGGGVIEVSMVDFRFIPNSPIVQPGTTIQWRNNGIFTHTTTRTGTWDSGFMNPNDFFNFTFNNAGLAYDYVCILHPGMEGVINVARFGDANLDGQVNLADFNILAVNFGQSGRIWDTGDFTGDGLVNLNDFNLLAANFGRMIDPAGRAPLVFGTFVPEPASAAALALPAMLCALQRRRRGG